MIKVWYTYCFGSFHFKCSQFSWFKNPYRRGFSYLLILKWMYPLTVHSVMTTHLCGGSTVSPQKIINNKLHSPLHPPSWWSVTPNPPICDPLSSAVRLEWPWSVIGPPRCQQNTLLNRWPPVTPYFLLMSQCSSHSDLYNKRNLKNKEEEEMLDDSRRSNQATELRLTNDRQPITYKWLSTKYSLITKITRIPPSSHTHSHTYRHRATHTPTLTRTHTHTHFSHCSPRVRNTEVGASDGENGHSTLNLTLLWAQ